MSCTPSYFAQHHSNYTFSVLKRPRVLRYKNLRGPLNKMNPATVAHPIASAWCSFTRTSASETVPTM
uniref:Uncharacterized protein n=1 Tax=Oryza brachyantha TaxID=4533 RepID=J3LNC6_ORYBR